MNSHLPGDQKRAAGFPLAAGIGLVGLVFFTLIATLDRGSTRIHSWPWVFYNQVLLLLPLIALGLSLVCGKKLRLAEGLALTVCGVVVGLTAALAKLPLFSLEVALLLWSGLASIGLVCIYLESERESSTKESPPTLRWASLLGLIFTLPLLSSLFLWGIDLVSFPPETGAGAGILHRLSLRNPHPLGHWNYTGGYALLVVPWLATLAWKERGAWRVFWSVAVACALMVLLSAGSRAAALGGAVSLVSALIVATASSGLSRRRATYLMIGAILGASALVGANPRLREMVLHPTTASEPNEGDVQRIGMLQGGWLLGKEKPWLGYGPGMTPFVYPEVRSRLIGGVETSFQLHNGPLQIWVDHGVLGVMAGAILMICLLMGATRWLRLGAAPSTAAVRPFALASVYSLCGYIPVFLTDYQFNVPQLVAIVALHAGVLLAAPSPKTSWAKIETARWPRVFGAAVLAGTAGLLFILVPEWRAKQSFWSAYWATPETDKKAILTHLHDAVVAAPSNPFYRTMLGLQLAQEAAAPANTQSAPALRKMAKQELLRSLKIDPAQEPVHASLGWLALEENPPEAESHFRQALHYIPDRDTVHFGIALCRLKQNDEKGAIENLALECLVYPAFCASPLWRESPFVQLKAKTRDTLETFIARLVQDPAIPSWRKSRLLYLRAWCRWWDGGPPPAAPDSLKEEPTVRVFFDQLRAKNQSETIPLLPGQLGGLWAAWHNPEKTLETLSARAPNLSKGALDGATARLQAGALSFEQLLRMPSPGNAGVMWQPVLRLHYNIMYRNVDGPGLPDLAPRANDAFVGEFTGFLIPPRGLVPGPQLTGLENPITRKP